MVQKYLAMVAILGAIVSISIGMVAEHVKAQVTQVDCDTGWDCCKTNPAACNNDMATTPHISQVECSNCAAYSDCNNGNTCSSIGQGGFSPVSFQPDNCFWSYPVQCSSLLPNNIANSNV